MHLGGAGGAAARSGSGLRMLPWHAKTHPNCSHEAVSLVREGTGSARLSLYDESNGGDE